MKKQTTPKANCQLSPNDVEPRLRSQRKSKQACISLTGTSLVNCQLDIISDYISEGLLGLDPAKPLAVIDWRLHLMYADDEAKLARWPWRWLIRMGLIERDVRYRRLLKTIVLYIELMRGRLQSDYEARLILAGTPRDEAHAKALERYGVHTGPLHFIVSDPDAKPLLLGTYDGDRIGFAEALNDNANDDANDNDNANENENVNENEKPRE